MSSHISVLRRFHFKTEKFKNIFQRFFRPKVYVFISPHDAIVFCNLQRNADESIALQIAGKKLLAVPTNPATLPKVEA